MRLYVIRHGETEWNKSKKMQGQKDIPLNEKGIELARKTGEGMLNIDFDLVITSPLKRAYDTALYVLGGRDVPIKTDDRLREICFGDWEGECVLGDKDKAMSDFLDMFYNHPAQCPAALGGESIMDVCKRTEEFCQEILNTPEYQDYNILISSHGCASRCFLNNFFDDKEDIWRGCIPKNCAVTIVDVCGNNSKVVELDKLF